MRTPSTLRRQRSLLLAAALLALLPAARADGQTPAPAAAAGPAVGAPAPDFALPAATRFGTLRDPVRLADLRGSTIVIAFFYQARTKG